MTFFLDCVALSSSMPSYIEKDLFLVAQVNALVLRLWILIRVIEDVVKSTRFLAAEGGYENHLGNLECVQEFQEMQVFGFFVLNGRIDIFLELFDDLETLVEACNGAYDTAVCPHHVLEHLLALFPEGRLCKADRFLLGLGNAQLFLGDAALFDIIDCTDGKYDAFQKRVRSKTVCSVNACCRNFTAGVEPLDFGAGPCVNENAAAHIVGCRNDRDPFLGDVNARIHAFRINVREMALDIFRRAAREVDVHVVLAETLHFAVDGASDDVAGREGVQRVHLVHEFFALVVLENAAETADSFGNEERLLELGSVQACGVELHELDILEGGTCAGCNRHAVTTAIGRANGVLPNAACATC